MDQNDEYDGEEGEFEINEDDLIEIGDDEQYVPPEGEEDEQMGEEEEGEGEQEDVFDDAVQVFGGHGHQPVYSVAAAHNGDAIVSGGGDDRAFVWTADKGIGFAASTHSDSVISVAFSANDEWVATGGMDGIVRVRNLASQKELSLEGPGSEIEWVAWHPKHLVVLAGSTDTIVWMWNVAEDGLQMGVFVGHTGPVSCGGFTPNGRRVLTGSMDGSLKLWEPNGTSILHTFSGHGFHEGGVLTFAAKPDGDPFIATGGSDGTVCLVRLDTKRILARFPHAEATAANSSKNHTEHEEGQEEEEQEDGCSVETLAFCSTLPWLVSGGTDGRVVVWDLSVQAKRSVLLHPDSQAIVRCIFLPQSVFLVTACADGKVRKYDVRASHLEKTLTGHHDAILDMALISDGKRVATASEDGTCRVFLVA
jgi:ribosome assembly protein SQT1